MFTLRQSVVVALLVGAGFVMTMAAPVVDLHLGAGENVVAVMSTVVSTALAAVAIMASLGTSDPTGGGGGRPAVADPAGKRFHDDLMLPKGSTFRTPAIP